VRTLLAEQASRNLGQGQDLVDLHMVEPNTSAFRTLIYLDFLYLHGFLQSVAGGAVHRLGIGHLSELSYPLGWPKEVGSPIDKPSCTLHNQGMKILVTGATGYVGGRLVPRLLQQGHEVRVLVRDGSRIAGRSWSDRVSVWVGDLKNPETLAGLCNDIDAGYYLVHSMVNDKDYAHSDRICVKNFVAQARDLKLCVYLGGLLPDQAVSSHLESRAEVGRTLRDNLPTTEFRAGPVIGSGSASFEMVRYLTERLPVMVTPKWVENQVQPINIRAVLDYLIAALEHPALDVVDIGGEVLTFKEMMVQYAQARGLSRTIIPLPVLAPKLAALWVGLVTPITNSLAKPLVEGIVTPVLGNTQKAEELFPDIRPFDYLYSVQLALERIQQRAVETRWSSSLAGRSSFQLTDREGLVREVRSTYVEVDPKYVFQSFASIGGKRGWLVWKWAWRVRGLIDQLVGGPGLRRGRRHPTEILAGEALDFWRVEKVVPDRRLVLRAEMKVPGRAWLSWEAKAEGSGSRLTQTALFSPKGFLGFLYWYSMYPAHRFIFGGMCQAIADDAVRLSRGEAVSC
jgi:uncharacterized protein YbjT (DUF2867 family)